MRLTCPNCDAQYEISAELIPNEGCDVQCSDCGHVWFQTHYGFADLSEEHDAPFIDGTSDFEEDHAAAPAIEPMQEAARGNAASALNAPPATQDTAEHSERDAPDADLSTAETPPPQVASIADPQEPPVPEPAVDTLSAPAEPTPDAAADDALSPADPRAFKPDTAQDAAHEAPPEAARPPAAGANLVPSSSDVALCASEDEAEQEDPVPADEPPLRRRAIDPSALDVLRQEVERETAARNAEAQRNAPRVEGQPDLGLQESEPPVRLRLRPRDPDAPSVSPAPTTTPAPKVHEPRQARLDQLPDIEHINSTLTRTPPARADQIQRDKELPAKRRTGFRAGFLLMIALGVIGWMTYSQAPMLEGKIPQAAPYLKSYVAQVDNARIWLDTQVKEITGL